MSTTNPNTASDLARLLAHYEATYATTDSFPHNFRAAFDQLDQANGNRNFLKLADLREALVQYARSDFDHGLNQLRRQRVFTLDSEEGKHSRLSEAERSAGIREGDSLLVYCSRRGRPR